MRTPPRSTSVSARSQPGRVPSGPSTLAPNTRYPSSATRCRSVSCPKSNSWFPSAPATTCRRFITATVGRPASQSDAGDPVNRSPASTTTLWQPPVHSRRACSMAADSATAPPVRRAPSCRGASVAWKSLMAITRTVRPVGAAPAAPPAGAPVAGAVPAASAPAPRRCSRYAAATAAAGSRVQLRSAYADRSSVPTRRASSISSWRMSTSFWYTTGAPASMAYPPPPPAR